MKHNLITLSLIMALSACNPFGDSNDDEKLISNPDAVPVDATLAGDLTAAVTTDAGDASGSATVTDPNDGEAVFETTATASYGTFAITSAGAWTYDLDETNTDVAALASSSDTLTDEITLTSADGTTATLTITITGVDPTNACSSTAELTVVGVIADNYDGSKLPSNVLDDDLDSTWAGNAGDDSVSLTVRLGDVSIVTELGLLWDKGNERTTSYKIETSKDNATWTEVLAQTDSVLQTGGEASETVALTGSVAEYLRLTGYGNSAGSAWTSLNDLKVNGCDSDETSEAVNTDATFSGALTGGIYNDTDTVTGTILISDIDGDAIVAQAKTTTSTGYGDFEIDAAGAWTYTLNTTDPMVSGLAEAATLDDVITVTADDGATTTVTITITGATVVVPGGMPLAIDEFSFTAGSLDNSGSANVQVAALSTSGNATISNTAGAEGTADTALNLAQGADNTAWGYLNYSGAAGSGLDQITGAYSTEAVVKVSSRALGNDIALIDFADTSNYLGFKTYIEKDDRSVKFKLYGNSTSTEVKSTEGTDVALQTLAVDTWYHIVSVYDPSVTTADGFGVATLYINGEEVFSKDLEWAPEDPDATDKAVFLGGSSSSDKNFDGAIDNIATFNDALTAAQVAERAASFGFGSSAIIAANTKMASLVDVITNVTNPGDEASGVLRYKRDYADALEQGKVTVSVRNNSTDQDAFFMLYGSSTSSSDALLDLRIKKNGGGFEIRSNDGSVADFTPVAVGEWMDISASWDASSDTEFATITLTINDETRTFTSFTGITDGDIKDDDTAAGRTTLQQIDYVRTVNFKLASDDAAADNSFDVDDIKVYSDIAGTTEVFSADFEDDLYVIGDDLEADTDPSPFDGSTVQATVAARP